MIPICMRILVKIDFAEVVKPEKSIKPVDLTLFINWVNKQFMIYHTTYVFLGVFFKELMGTESLN